MTEKKYKITYHKNECIGAFACIAAAPDSWKQTGDKADLIEGKDKGEEIYEKEISEAELEANMEAAQSCPVNCIHITECKTGRKLI